MTGTPVDFDLHGILRLRLLDARPGDVAVVERQLGPLRQPAQGDADITVRFVDSLPTASALTFVGFREAGFDSESFYLLKGHQGVSARTALPFADVGGRCDIVAERGAGAVPHLLAIVNLTALGKGVLPLHASAFVLDGQGVLATGWSKGGKTETLLAFAARGASYIGDEWIYLSAEGDMVGVPEPTRLWYWHLRQLPHVWERFSPLTRARLTGLDAAARAADRLAALLPERSGVGSVLRRGAPVVQRQAFRKVSPRDLFGADGRASRARLDALLLVTSHDRDDVVVEPVTGDLVAEMMRASLIEERAMFLAHYRQFRFAFPDRRSDVVERADEIEAKLLTRLFAGRAAYQVKHPYPFRLDTIVEPVTAALKDLADAQTAMTTGNHGGQP